MFVSRFLGSAAPLQWCGNQDTDLHNVKRRTRPVAYPNIYNLHRRAIFSASRAGSGAHSTVDVLRPGREDRHYTDKMVASTTSKISTTPGAHNTGSAISYGDNVPSPRHNIYSDFS